MVGDPLMTWKQLLAGDVNMDGNVDGLDLAIISTDWGRSVSSGGAGWSLDDLNGDGVIDMSDLALVSTTWGRFPRGPMRRHEFRLHRRLEHVW